MIILGGALHLLVHQQFQREASLGIEEMAEQNAAKSNKLLLTLS
jgi:hypothetical protein